MRALLHDDAGAEEADAGDDISRELRRPLAAVEMHAERHEGRCADSDEDIGAQARAALAPLALGADQRRQHKGDDDADGQIQQMPEAEIR